MFSQINRKNCQESFDGALIWFDKNLTKEDVFIKNAKECIEAGADINKNCEALRKTALSVAISRKNLKVLDFCVSNGANPNVSNLDGSTPLTLAILDKNMTVIELLLTHGLNVCKPDGEGRTPLSFAVTDGTVELVDLLLKNGAKFNIQTVLLDAIHLKNITIMQSFIWYGVQVNFQYQHCASTPLLEAIKTRNLNVVEELLIQKVNVNLTGLNGKSPLVTAVEIQCFEMVNLLVKNRADINQADTNGDIPLITATCLENFEILKYLVGQGADLDAINKNQECPLSAAAKNSNIQAFEFLVRVGAKVELARNKLEEVAKKNDDFLSYFITKFPKPMAKVMLSNPTQIKRRSNRLVKTAPKKKRKTK